MSQTGYRPDIDGLRAVAVMSVVLYHLKFAPTPGGFIGVDIFFVISGYLITNIINKELLSNNFSIAAFYERRIRRILPALFAVFIVTTIGVCLLFLPEDIAAYGKSLSAAALFVSNIFFWQHTDYFTELAEVNPLLHTWSLAVEEQFYIFFPLILMLLIKKFRKNYIVIITFLAVLSFVFSIWAVANNPTAAFYLATSRAWELMLGSLLALRVFPVIKSKLLLEALSFIGLLFLIYGFLTIHKGKPFPGLNAVYPCLGAMLILYTGEHAKTTIGRFLSLRPIVFIGLISYSLYLWHWPIVVFYNYFLSPTPIMKFVLLAICILMAIGSWHYIEKPWRNKKNSIGQIDRMPLLKLTASSIIVFAAVGVGMNVSDGAFSHHSKTASKLAAYAHYRNTSHPGLCFLTSNANDFNLYDKQTCLSKDTKKKNYLLIGDSHANHLWIGLAKSLPNVNLMQATASGCKPVLKSEGQVRCLKLMDYILNDYLPKNKVDALLISARWTTNDLELLLNSLDYYKKYATEVYVFGPTVEYYGNLPRILALSHDLKSDVMLKHSVVPDQFDMDKYLKSAVSSKGVHYISTLQTICSDRENCKRLTPSGVPYQFDNCHLTNEASVVLAEQWVNIRLIK